MHTIVGREKVQQKAGLEMNSRKNVQHSCVVQTVQKFELLTCSSSDGKKIL